METAPAASRRKPVTAAARTMITRQQSAAQGTPSLPTPAPRSDPSSVASTTTRRKNTLLERERGHDQSANTPIDPDSPPSSPSSTPLSSLSPPRATPSPLYQFPPRTTQRRRRQSSIGEYSHRDESQPRAVGARASQEPSRTSRDIPLDDTEAEEEEREKRLFQKVQRLRREARCREMEEEIDRLEKAKTLPKRPAPEPTSSEDGEPWRSHQRGREEQRSRSTRSDSGGPGVRPQPPPPYHGKNLRELQDFVRTCDMIFQGARRRYRTDRQKIAMALPFVKGETGYAYDREKERRGNDDAPTWEEFVNFLRDQVSDPVNRMLTAVQKYHDAKQGPVQRVQEFVSYLERLEAELDPFTETQRYQNLLAKINPDLRRRITDTLLVPTDRLGLIRLACRIEENQIARKAQMKTLQNDDDDNNAPRNPLRRFSRREPRLPSHEYQQRKILQQERSQKKEEGDVSSPATTVNRTPINDSSRRDAMSNGDFECYNCKKKGHYARDCRSTRRANAAQKPPKDESSSPKNYEAS